MRRIQSFSERLGGLERVKGIAAVPPRSDAVAKSEFVEAGADATRDGNTVLLSKQIEPFRKAGWSFIKRPTGRVAEAARPVFKDRDGQLKIDSGSLNVRFAKDLSEAEIETVLRDYGLAIRRSLGFAPNLFTVSRRGNAVKDSVEVARSLEASDKVEYAEPVLIEAISGR